MTYQEHFNNLRSDFSKTSNKLIAAENQLSETNGFGDMDLLNNFYNAKREFQNAANEYYNFLNHAREQKIQPSDEISI